MLSSRAFTLIELLIVVAIIAILAAIAVPNFLEAQTRAKVARAQSDMRTITIGLESYRVDDNRLPEGSQVFNPLSRSRITRLTTPVAYLSTLPDDPFYQRPTDPTELAGGPYGVGDKPLHFINEPNPAFSIRSYILFSYGPNKKMYRFDQQRESGGSAGPPPPNGILFYDPTNGTVSDGDIFRIGPNR